MEKFFDFRIVFGINALANDYICCTEDVFNHILQNKSSYFIEHKIPKKNKSRINETRNIWLINTSSIDRDCFEIVEELSSDISSKKLIDGNHLCQIYKGLSRKLYNFIQEIRPISNNVYGYMYGKSTLENARVHCDSKWLMKIDIDNFFNSIKHKMIVKNFIDIGVNENIANQLSRFVTINDTLPLGLHTSPIISNFICYEMDIKFEELAQKYNCRYTRYVDDISISSDNKLPEKQEIESILSEFNFILNEKKFRITRKGQSHYVTGLSISDTIPHVPKRMKKILRQEIYYCKKFGIINHIARRNNGFSIAYVNRIDGLIRYINHIEPKFNNIKKEWKEMMIKEKLCTSYKIEPKIIESQDIFFYIDETEFSCENKDFLALCVVKIFNKYDNIFFIKSI